MENTSNKALLLWSCSGRNIIFNNNVYIKGNNKVAEGNKYERTINRRKGKTI